VGLINSSWGGTPAQSWTTRQTLESDPSLKFIMDDWKVTLERYPAAKEKYDQALAAWKTAAAEAKQAGRTPPQAPRPPAGPGHQNTPAGLYSAMISPLFPTPSRRHLYQGRSMPTDRAFVYRQLFHAMIEDQRRGGDRGVSVRLRTRELQGERGGHPAQSQTGR
jgi:sialate O-acetylesterase